MPQPSGDNDPTRVDGRAMPGCPKPATLRVPTAREILDDPRCLECVPSDRLIEGVKVRLGPQPALAAQLVGGLMIREVQEGSRQEACKEEAGEPSESAFR
jgi:hypothetical protein